MKRRDFIKTAAVVGMTGSGLLAGTGLLTGCKEAGDKNGTAPSTQGFNFNRLGTGAGLKLSFEPYELLLRHTFTVSSY